MMLKTNLHKNGLNPLLPVYQLIIFCIWFNRTAQHIFWFFEQFITWCLIAEARDCCVDFPDVHVTAYVCNSAANTHLCHLMQQSTEFLLCHSNSQRLHKLCYVLGTWGFICCVENRCFVFEVCFKSYFTIFLKQESVVVILLFNASIICLHFACFNTL